MYTMSTMAWMIVALFILVCMIVIWKMTHHSDTTHKIYDSEIIGTNDVGLSNIRVPKPTMHNVKPKCLDDETRKRTDDYRKRFFEFSDRINNTTHLGDPVDNINITDKSRNYVLGGTIANIYDDLVDAPRE